MSRPNVTDDIIKGLAFARACVLDQRVASHQRKDHSWDDHYNEALAAIDVLMRAHKKAAKKAARSTS